MTMTITITITITIAPQRILGGRQVGRPITPRRCKLQLCWPEPETNTPLTFQLISAEDNSIRNLSRVISNSGPSKFVSSFHTCTSL